MNTKHDFLKLYTPSTKPIKYKKNPLKFDLDSLNPANTWSDNFNIFDWIVIIFVIVISI